MFSGYKESSRINIIESFQYYSQHSNYNRISGTLVYEWFMIKKCLGKWARERENNIKKNTKKIVLMNDGSDYERKK